MIKFGTVKKKFWSKILLTHVYFVFLLKIFILFFWHWLESLFISLIAWVVM